MKRISGGQTSVGADAKLLSSHAGDPRAATGDTTNTSHTGQPNGRSAASYRVSPPPARGTTGRVGRHRPSARTLTQRPVIRDDRLEETAIASRFPVAFRLPAFASRSSDSRRGVGPSLRSAYRARHSCPDLDRVTAFRTRELRPGWAPSIPRGRRCSPGLRRLSPAPAALTAASPCPPLPTSHPARTRLTRQTRIHTKFARPVFPSPVAARVERAALGLEPRASHLAGQEPTTHAEVGTGHRARTWNYRSTHIRRSPIR